jgi:hypothetical protein
MPFHGFYVLKNNRMPSHQEAQVAREEWNGWNALHCFLASKMTIVNISDIGSDVDDDVASSEASKSRISWSKAGDLEDRVLDMHMVAQLSAALPPNMW